jgi:hypothetical protein
MRQATGLVVFAIAVILAGCQTARVATPVAPAGSEAPPEGAPPAQPAPQLPPVGLQPAAQLTSERPQPKPPRYRGPRRVSAKDIQLPDGYVIAAFATRLTFPTGIAFDDLARQRLFSSSVTPTVATTSSSTASTASSAMRPRRGRRSGGVGPPGSGGPTGGGPP